MINMGHNWCSLRKVSVSQPSQIVIGVI